MSVPTREACLVNAAAAALAGQHVSTSGGNPAWVSAYAALGELWLRLRDTQDPDERVNPEDAATYEPPEACPTLCDTDCEQTCHAIHQPAHKRSHDPEDCPAQPTWP